MKRSRVSTVCTIAFLLAVLVIWSHRANIKRLLNHTESKTYFGKKPAEGEKKDGV